MVTKLNAYWNEKYIRLLYILSGMIGLSGFSGKAIVKTNL